MHATLPLSRPLPLLLALATACVLSACPGGDDSISPLPEPEPAAEPEPEPCNTRVFFADPDGDGIGTTTSPMSACAPPSGYVEEKGDNCPLHANPLQEDSDDDGQGDVCDPFPSPGSCQELTTGALVARFSTTASDGASGTVSAHTGSVTGDHAIRLVTTSGGMVTLRYQAPTAFSAASATVLEFAVRAANANAGGFQAGPIVVVEDSAGKRRTFTPSSPLLSTDGTWKRHVIPFPAGGGGFQTSGDVVDASAIVAVEVRADTWGAGFTLDVDGLVLASALGTCPLHCEGDCSANGTCDTTTLMCACDVGSVGASCESCADGFVSSGSQCVLPIDGDFSTWPNPVSFANSDPWLSVHHEKIEELSPKVLVLNFVNGSTDAHVTSLVDAVIAGFREGSRARGYANTSAPAQLTYTYARSIVDLRDGSGGNAPAPSSWSKINSTLLPRRPTGAPGWGFDYKQLFSSTFAARYGFVNPDAPSQHLALCELIERGLVHEVWVVASGDVPDAGMAEVLEAKPRYDASGNKLALPFDGCVGNGCFDDDVPLCLRSVRIGSINVTRGPGCYLHSQGHGMESLARRGAIPAYTAWAKPFMRFDLDTRFGLPVSDLYGLTCRDLDGADGNPPECAAYPSTISAHLYHQGATHTVSGYDAACGNVHFPPNARMHYETWNETAVSSSCTGFGRHAGALGDDAKTLVNASSWNAYDAIAGDCGGGFLVWWMQNMPGFQSAQTFDDGSVMKSAWPFLFY